MYYTSFRRFQELVVCQHPLDRISSRILVDLTTIRQLLEDEVEKDTTRGRGWQMSICYMAHPKATRLSDQ